MILMKEMKRDFLHSVANPPSYLPNSYYYDS
uniref:Uncharacterized protein n=1 Tax=Lepeophtheirus salmonis TaxID=72036 RepID=A0A0K2TWL1_LEPSM